MESPGRVHWKFTEALIGSNRPKATGKVFGCSVSNKNWSSLDSLPKGDLLECDCPVF